MSRVARPEVTHNAREGQKFDTDTTLHVEKCPTCHILFAIPETLYRSAQRYPGDGRNGWKLSCPLGHVWWYVGQTPEEKLREARNSLAAERARHDQTRADLVGTKAAKTRFRNERDRLKQRASAGVCPCCNRTFQQLARHMAAKHPDFAE